MIEPAHVLLSGRKPFRARDVRSVTPEHTGQATTYHTGSSMYNACVWSLELIAAHTDEWKIRSVPQCHVHGRLLSVTPGVRNEGGIASFHVCA